MDMRIAGRHALVTGASQGLGFAIAAALVAEGASVTICARNPQKVATAANKLGITGYSCDVSNAQDIEGLLATLNRESRSVDILVVNTGGPPQSTFASTDDAMWRSAFEALWLSSVRLIRGCIPGMLQRRWGRIILVTSISAKEPLPTLTLSNAIRPGLHGLVNTLSRELARDGITVNAVMPGFTLTERVAQVGFSANKPHSFPLVALPNLKNWAPWPRFWLQIRRATSPDKRLLATADILDRSSHAIGGSFSAARAAHQAFVRAALLTGAPRPFAGDFVGVSTAPISVGRVMRNRSSSLRAAVSETLGESTLNLARIWSAL